jgi:hypothetical protein
VSALEPVQGRIDRPFGKVKHATAALLQRLRDRVAMGRLPGEDRQQQAVKVSVRVDTKEPYA